MQKRKRGRQSQLFCHSHPHKINAMCHLTAMEGRGKGREELGVEEAFAFVFESMGKWYYRIPQEDQQTNCFLSLARGRPMTAVPCPYPGLSLSATSLPTEGGRDERDSNNGVGTGEAGNGSQRLSSASPPLPITKMTCGPSHGGPTTAVGLSFTGRSSHSSGIFQNLSI